MISKLHSNFVAWDFVHVGRDVNILFHSVAFLGYVLFTDGLATLSSLPFSVLDLA